jgi:hypothetical protein
MAHNTVLDRTASILVSPERLARAKMGYAARNVGPLRAPADPLTLVTGDEVRPDTGDVMLARVVGLGHHARLQLFNTRKAALYVGDEIVVVCSARYAPDQFLADLPQGLASCHLVATGGVAATVRSAHRAMREPTRLVPLGLLATMDGRRLNLIDHTTVASEPAPSARPKVIVVAGNAMNTGKTTAAVHLVRGLAQAGFRVGAAKVAGTVSYEDVLAMHDAGAVLARDFTDGGHATTVGLSMARLRGLFGGLIAELTRGGSEVIVIEVADGLLQAETAALLRDAECQRWIDGLLFATRDALGAIEGRAGCGSGGCRCSASAAYSPRPRWRWRKPRQPSTCRSTSRPRFSSQVGTTAHYCPIRTLPSRCCGPQVPAPNRHECRRRSGRPGRRAAVRDAEGHRRGPAADAGAAGLGRGGAVGLCRRVRLPAARARRPRRASGADQVPPDRVVRTDRALADRVAPRRARGDLAVDRGTQGARAADG